MRIIPQTIFARYPSRHDFEVMLVAKGYSCRPAGGSGGSILIAVNRNLVWKIADDPATAEFADLMSGRRTYPALPRVFAASPKNSAYGIVAMEKLVAFPFDDDWDRWYYKDYVAHAGAPTSDPFNAASTLVLLRSQAAAREVGLDTKAQNVMLRRRWPAQAVLFDPFF